MVALGSIPASRKAMCSLRAPDMETMVEEFKSLKVGEFTPCIDIIPHDISNAMKISMVLKFSIP
jgi:hypothetical protein